MNYSKVLELPNSRLFIWSKLAHQLCHSVFVAKYKVLQTINICKSGRLFWKYIYKTLAMMAKLVCGFDKSRVFASMALVARVELF